MRSLSIGVRLRELPQNLYNPRGAAIQRVGRHRPAVGVGSHAVPLSSIVAVALYLRTQLVGRIVHGHFPGLVIESVDITRTPVNEETVRSRQLVSPRRVLVARLMYAVDQNVAGHGRDANPPLP